MNTAKIKSNLEPLQFGYNFIKRFYLGNRLFPLSPHKFGFALFDYDFFARLSHGIDKTFKLRPADSLGGNSVRDRKSVG